MQGFLADPGAANAAAASRFAFIRQRFSVDYMADSIEALYRQALALRGRSAGF